MAQVYQVRLMVSPSGPLSVVAVLVSAFAFWNQRVVPDDSSYEFYVPIEAVKPEVVVAGPAPLCKCDCQCPAAVCSESTFVLDAGGVVGAFVAGVLTALCALRLVRSRSSVPLRAAIAADEFAAPRPLPAVLDREPENDEAVPLRRGRRIVRVARVQ